MPIRPVRGHSGLALVTKPELASEVIVVAATAIEFTMIAQIRPQELGRCLLPSSKSLVRVGAIVIEVDNTSFTLTQFVEPCQRLSAVVALIEVAIKASFEGLLGLMLVTVKPVITTMVEPVI